MIKIQVLILLLITALLLPISCSLSEDQCTQNCCRNKINTTNDVSEISEYKFENIDTLPPSTGLVCMLIGEEKEIRKEALKNEIFSQVKNIEALEFGYKFKFDDNPKFLIKLMDYILLEQACCPFLKYDFSILPFKHGIILKVTGEDEAKQIIKILVDEIQNERNGS